MLIMEKIQRNSVIIQCVLLCFFVYVLPSEQVGYKFLALLYLITFFFLSYFCIKLLIPPVKYDPVHAIVYGITLQISGCLCAQLYKDNDQSLLYTIPSFIIVVFLQKTILNNILMKFKKEKI